MLTTITSSVATRMWVQSGRSASKQHLIIPAFNPLRQSVVGARSIQVSSKLLSSATSEDAASGSKAVHVELFSRDQCMLCEEAREAILAAQRKTKFEFKETNILCPEAKRFLLRYQFHIPVVHVNDKYWAMHRIDTELLVEKVNELGRAQPGETAADSS